MLTKTCIGSVWWQLPNTDEINQRKTKYLEKYSVFID